MAHYAVNNAFNFRHSARFQAVFFLDMRRIKAPNAYLLGMKLNALIGRWTHASIQSILPATPT
jgi:hypothetical protein